MHLRLARWLPVAATAVLGVSPAQKPAGPPRPADHGQPIRVGVELVTADVIVRDRTGRFVPTPGKDDFDVSHRKEYVLRPQKR